MRSLLLIVVLAMLAAGCSSPVERKPFTCPPPPEPLCAPGKFDKMLLDTMFHGLGHIQSHITELPSPINSQAHDYSIAFVPSPNGMVAIVTSDRSDAARDAVVTRVQRLFASRFINTTHFGELRPVQTGSFSAPIGAGVYSKADGLFYFSAKAANGDPDDYDLFTGKLEFSGEDVELREIQPIPSLNSVSHFESQPALSPDGLNIYFVSDRPGGSGGTDIWHASRRSSSSQEWSPPQPLAPPINSECDEMSPYISPDDPNTLYFASNGHETVGGYDLFKSEIKRGVFSDPQNLGKPINSACDETFPVQLNDTALFWSSNVPSNQAGFNLFAITRTTLAGPVVKGHITEAPKPEIGRLKIDTMAAPRGPVSLEVHVTRGADYRPAVGSDVFIKRDSGTLFRGAVPANGAILFKVLPNQEYDAGAESEEAFFDVKHVDLRGLHDTTVRVDLHLPDTLVLRINFPFDDYQHPYEFVIDENGQPSNMTWRQALDLTAHAALRSQERLKELLLIGHTDSLGTDSYNDRLGLRRATFIADELQARGVPKRLLQVASKGRVQPVATRPGEDDELFRLRSRRVEFIKVFK
ncbi:MAG: OmpA family protein [Bacteroidota bacterium]|nr:OmpA family protein [Bacteroidota bacterium]MDP4234655.1 OmpA family protein [Bacteroidota bacterium]MDP4243820.1 OmpA family protein [Bacteroidota bacterium]MDP4288589.1 OmpA family protein [Bacteroidota bacterium]